MIVLDETLLLGQGTKRRCYVHPEDPGLCIKITSPRGQRSAKREIGYLDRIRRRGVSLAQIADYRGRVQTNLGSGDLYQLIRDCDGQVSKGLRHYLRAGDADLTRRIVAAIEALRLYLRRNAILFSDLKVDNLLVQKTCAGEFRLVIIDGVGDNNQIQFLEYFRPLGLRQSIKKWQGFIADVARDFPEVSRQIRPFAA